METRTARALGDARISGLPSDVRERFNRIPFGYEHNLAELELFDFDVLCDLARTYERDYFVAAGAPSAGTPFYSVAAGARAPHEAMLRLDREQYRVLLKRPEQYDPRYRELMHVLFDQVLQMRGGLAPGERVVRLDSSILISSAATITPFHFDPEVSSFFQIQGEKIYHLYAPSALSEAELERFYWMGIVNIGEVELAARRPQDEHVFRLRAGLGMHQPQDSPHWVETRNERTISFVFSFETTASRERGRTRACNHYLRKLGLTPAAPGVRPKLDGVKARVMDIAIPVRKGLGSLVRRERPG
jgi:hypothetical protein